MAEPKTEIDRRLDRIELAISTMASWLVQAQIGFGSRDAEGIEKILRGELSTQQREVNQMTEQDTGAMGEAQKVAEDMANKAVHLASSAVDVPREAVGGVLSAVARTMAALGKLAEDLSSTVSGS